MQSDKSEPSDAKGSECVSTSDPEKKALSTVETEGPKPKGISAVAVLWTFGKCLGALLPVYLAGYYRVSTSLLVFGMMVYTGWKHAREAKEARLKSAIQLTNEEYTSMKVSKIKRDLPAWVNFPDVEKVEWLNKVLQQVWPFVGQYLEKLLVETIAPSIRASSTHLQTLNFTKVDMGDKAMKVVGIKAHTENDKGQVLLDLYISYVGNVEINVEVKRYFCKAGVKGIQLHGMMRVILEPLIGDVPIVGAVTMFFIQRPKLDINWTGLTNLLDIPGLNIMSDSMIMDAIASFLVLPNRLVVPLVPDLHVAQLRSPLPRGVVRIHLLEAQNLAAKDNYVKGVMAGLSDPYAILRVGPQTFTSKHIDNTDSPQWKEMYEVIVHEVPGQELEVEVYDKDTDQDDFLGRLKISLKDIIDSQYTDQWYTLSDVKSGRIHLIVEWVPTSSESDRLDQVLTFHSRQSYQNKAVPSAGLLFVFMAQADGLPVKKSGKEPKVGAHISLGKMSHKTTVCDRTTSPQWNEAFCFRVRDPREEIFVAKLSHSWTLPIGSLVVPIRELLSEPELVLDQWFHLDGASPESRILLRAELKLLIPSKCLGATDKAMVTSASDPPPAQKKQDIDTVKRSSSVDVPVETIASSVTLHEDVDVKEMPAPVTEEKVEESPSPAIPQPPHTSPDLSFASEGLLRIILLEAQSLVAKDNMMGGMVKGKSDPYAKINVGGAAFKSNVIKENLNPVWNEMYEVVLRPQAGQEVQVELYDKDMDKDDFLGRYKISVADIIRSKYTDQWYTLEDVKSGRVRLILEWVPAVSHNNTLDQVMQVQALQSYKNKVVPSAALLFVYVDRAHSLPFKKSGKDPKAGAELVFGNRTHKTKVCDRSRSPQWDEAFYFLVCDPKEEILIIKLSSEWDQPLGSLVVPLRELLSEPQLVLDQWMPLDGALPESEILLRAELKVLSSRMTEAPQLSVADSKKEEMVISTNQAFKAASEDKKSSELPKDKPVAVASQVKHSGVADAAPAEPAAIHTALDTLPAAALVKDPRAPEIHPTQSDKAFKEDFEPQQNQTGTGLGNLAQATVTGLPADTLRPPKTTEIPKAGVVLPAKTTPSQHFGKEGLLRIHLLEAQNLVAKDNLMGGMVKGKSDPYVKINIGDVTFKSHVIKENLNPTWKEMYELVLSGHSVQWIKLEAFDKDLDSDDFLGRFSIKLNEVIRSQYTDQWYTLNDVKSGRIHLILEWVPTVSQPVRLDQVLQLQSLQSYQNKAVPSAALLFVHIERAHSLPLKKSGKEPKAGAELVLGETTYKTKLCDRSTSPQWNESFYFLVHDPKHQMLVVKLSSGWDQPMGSLVIPVKELLAVPQLVLDQWFHLDGAAPESQMLLRAELKILDSKMVDMISAGTLPCAASGCGSGNGQVKLSVSYSSQERLLIVIVHACRGLLSQSKDGVDSYVSIMLLPDKSKATKRKTSVKKKDLNPEYNERFEYNLSVDEMRFRRLVVSVKNNAASFRSRDVIGQVQIELSQVDLVSGVTEWFTLKDEAE
ncbi:extended synaptotagmin-1 isoform X2 [Etheostoma cragini]|uniref:extended synaptotagmin-1 isoform X2 n=1 Tax=Etheostoma cragini TaxID=417921 RepID=UPI00155F0E84|nr:extended synaptotagmin-1 isoform X2 [Etheostoma cragini]